MKTELFTISYSSLLLLGMMIMVVFLLVIVTFSWFHQKKRAVEENKEFMLQGERQRKLLEVMINREERERLKLGQELHDNIGVKLAVSKERIRNFLEEIPDNSIRDRLNEVVQVLENSSQKITEISRQITPPLLHKSGLYRSLEQFASQLSQSGKTDVYCHPGSYSKQNDLLEIMLYRIAVEIIENAVKHGKPNRIDIYLVISGDYVEMEIRDNGLPFDLSRKIAQNNGMSVSNGLSNIEGRLQNCRATLMYAHENGSNKNRVSCSILPVQEMA